MPLSLALLSDMGGISAMDQKKNLAMGLVLFPIPSLGIFQSNGAEIFVAENHKRKSLYKNHSNQHNSKGLHTILVPFKYVDMVIKTLFFYLINIPRQ